MATKIRNTQRLFAAPALPNPTPEYRVDIESQRLKVLRLYFANIDEAITQALQYDTDDIIDGSIPNSKLENSTVSFGGVTLSLGGSDATPAFNLSDATGYPTSSLVGTIATAQIADDAVTDAKLADSINSAIAANTAKVTNATHTGEVTGATALTIADGAVVTARIADDAVTQAKIADNAIGSDQIASGAVIAGKLQTSSVATSNIQSDAVTNDKIADDAVDTAQIADDAVDNAQIADNAVSAAQIASNAVTTAKIATGAVGTGSIADSAVTAAKLADTYLTSTLSATLNAGDQEIQNVKELGIGFSGSPSYQFHIEDSKGATSTELSRIKQTGSHTGRIITFYKSSNFHGSIGLTSVIYGQGIYAASAGGGLKFQNQFSTVVVEPCGTDGTDKDNSVDLGRSSNRFDDIYATNSTIQTSDRNEKQDIQTVTDAERRVATAAKGLIRRFRWKDAVAEKGDSARLHFGVIAQDLEAAFTAEGLDASNYAMFCSNTWWEHGGEKYEEAEDAPAGSIEITRRGVRYSELLAFIISAI